MSETAPSSSRSWPPLVRPLLARLLVVAAFLTCGAGAVSAHHRGVAHAAPADAIVIPNLAHGQMAVLYAYRQRILDMAARMPRTDATLRRLVAFVNLQFSGCLWGMMPGSVTDEDSPFNECTHAYLAATRALLVHMQAMGAAEAEVDALAAEIQRALAASRTSLAMCRYSDEPFNTAERVSPHWGAIASHPPTLAVLVGSVSMIVALAWVLVAWGRRAPPAPPRPTLV